MAILQNIWAWSTAEATNATVDSAILWSEGQDPATVNNSARNMMAASKRMANVQSGNVVVVGTDAITITTGQAIEAAQQALGFRICFRAAATNTGPVTVAIDGLSAVAIKRPNNDALSAGDIVSGAFHDIAFDGTNYRLLVPGGTGTYGALASSNTWTGSNVFQAGATIGDDAADVVVIKGSTVSPVSSAFLAATSVAAWHANLGLGTAAVRNTGTSGITEGAVVPLLNGQNTFSAAQTIAANSTVRNPLVVQDTGAIAGSGPFYVALWYDNDVGGGVGNVCGSVSINPSANTCIYNTTSDGRLKRDIAPLADSGTVIDSLNPVRFRWNHGNNDADFGFVAQDLQAIVPQAVSTGRGNPGEANFIPWGMQHGRLEAILVAEIKALRARVAALEAG